MSQRHRRHLKDILTDLKLYFNNAKTLQTLSEDVSENVIKEMVRKGNQCFTELKECLSELSKGGAPHEFLENLLKMEKKWEMVVKTVQRYCETVDNRKVKAYLEKNNESEIDWEYVSDYLADVETCLKDCQEDFDAFSKHVLVIVNQIEVMEWPKYQLNDDDELYVILTTILDFFRWLCCCCKPCQKRSSMSSSGQAASYGAIDDCEASSSYRTGESSKNTDREDRFRMTKESYKKLFNSSEELNEFTRQLSDEMSRIKDLRRRLSS